MIQLLSVFCYTLSLALSRSTFAPVSCGKYQNSTLFHLCRSIECCLSMFSNNCTSARKKEKQPGRRLFLPMFGFLFFWIPFYVVLKIIFLSGVTWDHWNGVHKIRVSTNFVTLVKITLICCNTSCSLVLKLKTCSQITYYEIIFFCFFDY